MKVIIEVEEYSKCYSFQAKAGWKTTLNKEDCEPVQEGWITEEQFSELYRKCGERGYAHCLNYAKERGWINPSKTAKQKFEELAIKPILVDGSCSSVAQYIQNIVEAAKEAIQEAESE